MAFIRTGNRIVPISFLSFFLSLIIFNTAHSAHNYYSQFGLLDNPYSQARAPYKPLPPTPSDILALQRYSKQLDHFDFPSITFRSARPIYDQKEVPDYFQQLAEQERDEREKKEIERAPLRKIVANTLATQTPEIHSLIDHTTNFHKQISNAESSAKYLTTRIKYLQEYLNNPNYWDDAFYSLSKEESTFLKQHACSTNFNSFYGNHLQQGIHKEHITIISQATTIEKNCEGNTSKIKMCTFIVKALETSHQHKVQGNIFSALEINDVCFHLLSPKQQGYLAPQLAALQTHASISQSTELDDAFKDLKNAALHDPQLASCINAASKFVDQFKKAGRNFQLQVLEIVTEMSLHEFADIPIQEQFEFLEKHHEGIAIKALCSLNHENSAQVIDYATKILNLEPPQSASNNHLLKTLLSPEDSLARTKKLTSTPYPSFGQGIFLCKDGILHEHAILRDLHQLPVPPQHYLTPATHEFLHTYYTSTSPEEQELAYYGLYHQKQISLSSDREHMRRHELLAHDYYDTLYKNKQSNLLEWGNALARTYNNSYGQEVHNELIWITHQFIAADAKVSTNDSVTKCLLHEIKDTLIEAHAYNQLNQSEASHELIKNITDIFVAPSFVKQDRSLYYQDLNLAQTTTKIESNLKSTINSLKEILEQSKSTPNEKLAYAREELLRLSIQSGKLIRDKSQLSQREHDELSERTALQPSRHPVKQTLINKLAKKAMLEFDIRFPQFKKNLSQEEYLAHKKKYVRTCYGKYKKQAASCPERTLDILTGYVDPTIASIKSADAVGFIIHQNKDLIDIKYVPENTLKDFKEVWPTTDVMKDIISLWDSEVPLCAINRQEAASVRYAQREAAYQETQNAPYIFVEKSYTISDESQQLLQKNEIDYDHLTHGFYNPLQDQLHTELLEILEQTTLLDAQDSVEDLFRPCNNMMLDFVSTAAYANQHGDIIKTMTLADFCWGALNCGQALCEGLRDGTIDTVKYAYAHPLETILFTVAGNYMLYYQVGKLSYELTNMAIESYLSKPEENPKPKEPLFFRDLVKAAAHFGAQMATNHAINLGVTKCIQAGLNELFPVIDKLVAEEASALAHDHAPQFARPRERVQVMTDNGEVIEVIMPHENFSSSGNSISTKTVKGGGSIKPNNTQQNPLPIVVPNKLQNTISGQNNTTANICKQHKHDQYNTYIVEVLKPHEEFLKKNLPVKITEIEFYHCMEKDTKKNGKDISGYHSGRYHPELIIQDLDGPNEHGIKKSLIGSGTKTKESTIFPPSWDEKIITEKVCEALLTGNIIKTQANGNIKVLGTAQNYIPGKGIFPIEIEMWISADGKIRPYPKYKP